MSVKDTTPVEDESVDEDAPAFSDPAAKAARVRAVQQIQIAANTYTPAPHRPAPGVQAWNDEILANARHAARARSATTTRLAHHPAHDRCSHASAPGHRRSASTSSTSSQDPGDGGGEGGDGDPAGLTPDRHQFAQRRAATLGFRARVAGGMTAMIFAEGTAGMTAAERLVVASWLTLDDRLALLADRGTA